MSFIKQVFTISLIGLSQQSFAEPIKIECSDKTVIYDSETLKNLYSWIIEADYYRWRVKSNQSINEVDIDAKIRLEFIDSKGFAFMMTLANKNDAEAFSFIDSLDDQAFILICFYTSILKANRISDFLKFKMLMNPKFQKLAAVSDERMQIFIKSMLDRHIQVNDNHWITYGKKYLDRELTPRYSGSHRSISLNSIKALLVLVHFFHETFKKSFPINTDYWKQVFYEQPNDIQRTLIDKNLIILRVR